MASSYNVTDIVKTAQKSTPLPANYNVLDEISKRRLYREAEAQGITPEAHYAATRARYEQDAADDFDPTAVALATRR